MANITNTRFFFESDVHQWLFNKYDDLGEVTIVKNSEFAYDVMDQPFYCAVRSGEQDIEIKLYVRSEMGPFLENPDLGIQISTNGEKAKVTANTGRLGGNAAQTIMLFFKAAVILGMKIGEKDLAAELSDLDTEKEGIRVTLEGEELSFQKVAGKARPNMACTTLFGGVQMMRPYQDEIMDSWMDDLMPIEEKIELAEDGDEEMMEQLALAYLNGDDEVEEDPQQAAYWFEKLAELDHATAQFNLALLYAKGHGVEHSFGKAVHWLQQAGENGDTDAPALIEKLQKAVAAEEKVASGDPQAQADLAAAYMFVGNSLAQAGPDRDYALALEYAQKSAAQNNGDGLWTLALAYEHGRGVAQDKAEAVECYRKGAQLGHAPSLHSLACYYMRGEVVEMDQEKAVQLCLQSAQQGYELAYFFLAKAYELGNGVDEDLDEALKWGEKAAENGTPDVQYEVAKLYMYDTGDGMIDAERARYWLAKAAGRGHEKAYDMLNFAPLWNEEPSEAEAEDELDLPEGYGEMMDLFIFAEENGYEDDGSISTAGQIAFVEKLAREGNTEAQQILEAYRKANG